MYALVEIKGKQYKAEKGNTLKVDRIEGVKGDTVEFDSVLMVHDDNGVKIGTPYVDGAKVSSIVEEQGRDRKVVVYKYKKRKNYRRKRGHRQAFTLLRVDNIVGE